jgi:ubiquinone/menaquinone biosynthesis C-methylase UbiE
MGAENNQPDWDKIAEKFDMWLPQIGPTGDALLEALGAQAGDYILDVASGTGEPALTLARRMGDKVKILGIDAAPGMAKVAQSKVDKEGLTNITFQTMPAENMEFADETFDRILCRFGVMLFDDSLEGLKEMYRVLKKDGRFSLAVWSTPETMLTMYWTYEVFKNRVPEDYYPPLTKVTSLGPPGVMEDFLVEAGFNNFNIERKTIQYEFESFDSYWDLVEASDILKMQYDALPEDQRHEIRDEVGRFARDFIQQGRLVVPHEYLLVSGNKTEYH